MLSTDLRLIVGETRYGRSGGVVFAEYANGETAMRIVAGDGEPQCTATVFIEGVPPGPKDAGLVWIKTWSENEGVFEALIDAGVIEPLARWLAVAHDAVARLAKLTPAAQAELARQKREAE